jgi:hypothetical protein
MLDYDGLDTTYAFGVSASSWYDGEYSFGVTVAEYDDFSDTYSYVRSKGERYKPQVGYWTPFAQVVGNEFPLWHAGRTNFFSRTQRFLNILSHPLWEFDQRLQYDRRNRYISTVDMFQPDSAHRIGVNVPLQLDSKDVTDPKNLLANPDFSIPGLARYNMPWRWTDRFTATTGTVAHYEDNALMGSGCVRMFAAAGKSCFLRQNVQKTLGVNDSVTASAFVLVPIPETAGTSEGDLVITVLYADGTSKMQKTALPGGTDGAWRRISATITPTKRVVRVDFMIAIVNELAHDYEVFVDACQLELGTAPTSFFRRRGERLHWMDPDERPAPYFVEALGSASSRTVEHVTGSPTTYSEYQRYRIWPTQDVYQWWLNAIPTRVDTMAVDSESLEANVQFRYGFEASPHDRARRAAIFQISSDKTKIEWAIEETPIDVLFSYQLADHHMDGGNWDEYGIADVEDTSYSIAIEAITLHKDLLWVVAKETWNSTTLRVLKVCLPFQRPDVLADSAQPNFLEVLQDYDLGLATGTVSAIGFAEGDDSKLLLTLDGGEYVAQLWYDYALYDEEVATSTLLRHNYQGKDLVLR